jgi:excisionase family DNA binding protein
MLDLTPEVAGHLAVALANYRKWAATSGMQVPAVLRELQSASASRAMAGQTGTPLGDLWQVQQSRTMTPRLVTQAEAGVMLSCSDRTIRRLVASGQLTAIRFNGSTRLRVTDIDAFIDQLQNEGA